VDYAVQQGLIKAFEYTFELGWLTIKDLLIERGQKKIMGSRDVIRLSFSLPLVFDGEVWMDMIDWWNNATP
jgi:nucleotidyltransferase substrate binding protein (TIGR01987 family)